MIKAITLFFKHFSIFKGHAVYSIVGGAIIVIALYVMVAAKSITTEGIELLTLGITIAGINNEMVDKIKNRNSDSSNPPTE